MTQLSTNLSIATEFINQNDYQLSLNGKPFSLIVLPYALEVQDKLGCSPLGFLSRLDCANGLWQLWCPISDSKAIWDILINNIETNSNYFYDLIEIYKQSINANQVLFKKIRTEDFSKYTESELLKIWHDSYNAIGVAIGYSYLLDPIGFEIENVLLNCLENEGISNPRKLLTLITQPDEISYTLREEQELKQIQDEKLDEDTIKLKLKEHIQKWYWINTTYAGRAQISETDIFNRLRELSTEHLPKINDKFEIENYGAFSSKTQKIVDLVKFSGMWQDRRKANTLEAIWCFCEICDFITEKLKIEQDAILNFLPDEIIASRDFKDILSNLITTKTRNLKPFYYLRNQTQSVAFSHQESINIDLIRDQININTDVLEIHGNIASLGKYSGVIKVIHQPGKFKNFQKGDILVTSMTRPEFVPIMKLAGAIITDEGGITCHAAIVSRELDIPCIVGTKIATQVLHDGDEVEVDAFHGVIKFIKNN